MTIDEIERAFRLGCCASARLASEERGGCGPQMRALEAVREMARDRDEARAERDAWKAAVLRQAPHPPRSSEARRALPPARRCTGSVPHDAALRAAWDARCAVTRLESAALDYAIACLARGQRPESLEHLREYVDGDAYSRAIELVMTERLRASGPTGSLVYECRAYARRIVRARLALYLRLVRRADAWEQYERWARPRGVFAGVRVVITTRSGGTHDAWHPLWLDAPAYDPLVSPRQRREQCPECGRSLLASPVVVCIQCHRESA